MRMIVGLLMCFCANLWAVNGTAKEARRPNVILFFSDDQGTLDMNCYGSKDLLTPSMDALASRGVRFTQFYAAAPVCSPSRAALLTGRYPMRAGVPGNVGIHSDGMPTDQVTIAEMLRKAGYATGLVGKWHLGQQGANPQGFDYFFGHKRGCIDNYSHFFYWSGPNNHDLWKNDREVFEDGTHFADLMVRETNQFLERHQDKPFFLYVPFNNPHYPYQGQERFRKHYAKLPTPRREYAAMLSTMDEKLGQILAKVDELKLRDNTLIIFLSDHGHSTEERAMFGGGNAGTYRGAKFSLFEGGIRVPCLAALPDVIPEGAVRDQLAVNVDWLPTIAELCGAKLPKRTIDGRSIVPLLKSDSAKASHAVFHWQQGNQWAVRQGEWKLVVNGRDANRASAQGRPKTVLSNMAIDTTETKSLAKEHPEVVERLTRLHQVWAKQVRNP